MQGRNTDRPVWVVDVERHLPLAQSTVSYDLKAVFEARPICRDRVTGNV